MTKENIFSEEKEGEVWYWVPHETHAFVPAKYVEEINQIILFETLDGKTLRIPSSTLGSLSTLKKSLLKYYTHVVHSFIK